MTNDELRRQVQAGIDQANRGELLDSTEVFRRLEERARQIEEASRSGGNPHGSEQPT